MVYFMDFENNYYFDNEAKSNKSIKMEIRMIVVVSGLSVGWNDKLSSRHSDLNVSDFPK